MVCSSPSSTRPPVSFLGRRNHPAAHSLLEGICGDVPAQRGENGTGEKAERQKEVPQNTPAHRRNSIRRLLGPLL